MVFDYDIQNCADLNNQGIEQEKRGEIDLAISTYERNVSMGYAATHAYERLMIIYRKRKDYDNEIRVITKAISIFSDENERRAKAAIERNPTKTKEIIYGLKTCTAVYGDNVNFAGVKMICFSPYNVNKYKKRLEKAKQLKQKQYGK